MKLKKRIAAMGAAVMMAVSMMSVNANAQTEKKNWTASHANYYGAPSSASIVGHVSMHATTEKYTGYVSSMTNLSNRRVRISTSSSHNIMQKGTVQDYIEYTNIGSDSWTISGSLSTVYYDITARTTITGTLYTTGYIKR